MAFDYFYGAQSQQFAFYRIPKVLFTDNRFQNISTEGKVLYGLLLDRVSLSMENGWIDDEGRVYIIFTLTSIRQAMSCAEKSAIKYLTELEEFGLIERIRQGFGKPALIYVKNFIDQQNLQVKTVAKIIFRYNTEHNLNISKSKVCIKDNNLFPHPC